MHNDSPASVAAYLQAAEHLDSVDYGVAKQPCPEARYAATPHRVSLALRVAVLWSNSPHKLLGKVGKDPVCPEKPDDSGFTRVCGTQRSRRSGGGNQDHSPVTPGYICSVETFPDEQGIRRRATHSVGHLAMVDCAHSYSVTSRA
jgi:hypothetical protein